MTRLLRQQRPVLSPPRRMFEDAIIPSIKHADLLRGRTRNGAAVQHHHNGLNRLHPAATANTRHATPTCGLTVPQCVCGFPMAFFWCTALRTACCCALSIKCWCPAVMTVHADTQTKVRASRPGIMSGGNLLSGWCCNKFHQNKVCIGKSMRSAQEGFRLGIPSSRQPIWRLSEPPKQDQLDRTERSE